MNSFALVYFDKEKRYGAVAVATIKGGCKNVNKGSEVIVLGSTFDPLLAGDLRFFCPVSRSPALVHKSPAFYLHFNSY